MPRLSRRVPGTLALCIAAVVGCNSAKHLAQTPTGSMTVTVNAADGTAPSIVITGPKSYSKTITATQTLTGLALGSYTIVADSAVGPDAVVGTNVDTGTVTGSPSIVVNATTSTVTVSYAMKRHVGGMWIANNDTQTIPELASSQLRSSGTAVPAETLGTHLSAPAGLAIDASGNMWESSWQKDSLVMYSPAARNAGAGAAPTTAIMSTALSSAENLAFDAHGNLWVANCGGTIVEYTPAQLTAGGTQVPAITISATTLTCPWSIAFDSSGNAWVADLHHTHLVEFSAAQLATGGVLTPVDTIGATAGSLASPDGVAFDASGNLWVSNGGNNKTVVEFTPAQLAAGGAPAPTVIVTLPANTSLFGIAFDNRGTLWASSVSNHIMYGLTRAQLAATGSPTPAVADTVSLSSFGPEQPVFDAFATASVVATARIGHAVAPLARSVYSRHVQLNHQDYFAR
jgi:sugar lactone lactonase YvrE